MKSRRELLLGMVAGVAGTAMVSGRAAAWYYEELTPDQAAALAARACGSAGGTDNHTGLVAAARQDLLQRIGKGFLPAGSSEQVGCPLCGCSFIVTADGTH